MKRNLLLLVVIMVLAMSSAAQSGGILFGDSANLKAGFQQKLKLHWQSDSLNYTQMLNHPAITATVPDLRAAEKQIFLGRPATIAIKVPHSYDNMPCLAPQGNFTMPVVRPDSSKKYTLLIKKIP